MKKNKQSNSLFVISIIITILLASILAFLVATIPYSNVEKSFLCKDLMNESFNNGTMYGYQLGIKDTSDFVLRTRSLPVFVNNFGNIEIEYLNLSEEFCYDD